MSIPKERLICYIRPATKICFDAGRIVTKQEREERREIYKQNQKSKRLITKTIKKMITKKKEKEKEEDIHPDELKKLAESRNIDMYTKKINNAFELK